MKYILPIVIFILALLTSCSKEENSIIDNSPVAVSFSMKVADTRSETPEANELINQWWLAFVDGDNTIVDIVESGNIAPTNIDECTIELDPGTYTIYAFANMGAERFGFAVGGKLPADIDTRLWTTLPTADELVPMSGKTTVAIRQQASRHFVVEVVRVVAKMRTVIRNLTGEDITVNSVALLPAQTGKVFLMPDYESLAKAPKLPEDAVSSELFRPINKKIAFRDSIVDKYYFFESTAAAHPTGHYVVKLGMTRDKSGRTDTITALTDQMEWINRNDYIILPLDIIDYILTPDVLFYPPIGGYPAVLLDRKSDEYYATFSSSGKFVVNTHLSTSYGQVLAPRQYTLKSIEVNDPANIFGNTPPAIDTTTREIIGEFPVEGNKGTATVKIAVTVPNNFGSTPVSYTFTRTLYIIRK